MHFTTTLAAVGLLAATAGTALAQDRATIGDPPTRSERGAAADRANPMDRDTDRAGIPGTPAVCADGTIYRAGTNECANHGGVAAVQPVPPKPVTTTPGDAARDAGTGPADATRVAEGERPMRGNPPAHDAVRQGDAGARGMSAEAGSVNDSAAIQREARRQQGTPQGTIAGGMRGPNSTPDGSATHTPPRVGEPPNAGPAVAIDPTRVPATDAPPRPTRGQGSPGSQQGSRNGQ